MVKKHSEQAPTINPFMAVIDGINTLFTRAISVGVFMAIVGVLGAFSGLISPDAGSTETERRQNVDKFFDTIQQLDVAQWLTIIAVVIVICMFILVVSAMIHGIQSYTVAQLSKGKTVTLKEAFLAVLEQFGGYLVLYVWMNIKIFLWSLLLFIPGVIASLRYSFAGPLFFDKDLKHENAIKESNRLTKGGLVTIFASQFLFNLITLGYLANIVSTASLATLYDKYVSYDHVKLKKPPTHWLSWVTLAMPFIMFVLFVLLLIGVFFVAAGLGSFGK